nr:hypothetical protein [Mycobacterium attenuatum]
MPRIHRSEDQRVHHPVAARSGIEDLAHRPEVDLALHTGLAIDDWHRVSGTAAPVGGALRAVPVQGPLRHHRAAPRQQIADLDHRQVRADPFGDLIMVGAQQLPRRTVAIRSTRTHRLDHRADQLVGELIQITAPVQPRQYCRVRIVACGLAIHPSQHAHPAQAAPAIHTRNNSRTSTTETSRYIQRTTFTSIDMK